VKLTEHLHLIGSGRLGFNLTDELDCHSFLIATVDDGVRALFAVEALIASARRNEEIAIPWPEDLIP